MPRSTSDDSSIVCCTGSERKKLSTQSLWKIRQSIMFLLIFIYCSYSCDGGMDPNPKWLVSLEKGEVETHSCRKDNVKRHRPTMIFCKSRREAWNDFFCHNYQKEPTLWRPWFQTLRFQKWETMYFCCLSHLVCGSLLRKPELTNTAPSGHPYIYDRDSSPSFSGTLWNISVYTSVDLPSSFLSHQHKVVSSLTTNKQKSQTTQSVLTHEQYLVTNALFKPCVISHLFDKS